MVSFSYVLTLFWSKLFFREKITVGKVSAIAVILCGLVCIGLGAS
jgi:drug/metabolite transporter (DMT)-like permease